MLKEWAARLIATGVEQGLAAPEQAVGQRRCFQPEANGTAHGKGAEAGITGGGFSSYFGNWPPFKWTVKNVLGGKVQRYRRFPCIHEQLLGTGFSGDEYTWLFGFVFSSSGLSQPLELLG